MFILARRGQTYARLRFNVGPKGEVLVPVSVAYDLPFPASDHEAWLREYEQNIHIEPLGANMPNVPTKTMSILDEPWPGDVEAIMEDQRLELLAGAEGLDAADLDDFLFNESEAWR